MPSVDGVIPDAPDRRSPDGDLDSPGGPPKSPTRKRIVLSGEPLSAQTPSAVVQQVVIDIGPADDPAGSTSNAWADLLHCIVEGWPTTLRASLLLIILLGSLIAVAALAFGLGSAALVAIGLILIKWVLVSRGRKATSG